MTDVPLTEALNARSTELDLLDTRAVLQLINDEDASVAPAVAAALDSIAAAVDAIAGKLRSGGRLHYFGAGSSGRLAVLDAAEIAPTFSAPDLVAAHIAG